LLPEFREPPCRYEDDKQANNAIENLISDHLVPAGSAFVDELVHRYRLAKLNSIERSKDRINQSLGERKIIRGVISALSVKDTRDRFATAGRQLAAD
jgi:hypothetical protein